MPDPQPAARPAPNHEGTTFLRHSGKDVPLRFEMRVWAALQQDHGVDGCWDYIARALDNFDAAAMVRMMALFADVDEARAAELCIPLVPARDALKKAWITGVTGGEEHDAAAEKTRPQLTLSELLSKLPFGLGSAGATSGGSPRTPSASSAAPTLTTGAT
jgi:hypothetical protein